MSNEGAGLLLSIVILLPWIILDSWRGDRRAKSANAMRTRRLGPIGPVLDRIDPRLASPMFLRADECADLVAFVRTGLFDRRALPQKLCAVIPASLPSGMTPLRFETCPHN